MFIFLFLTSSANAQITIGTIDVGPYGLGSSISVPITMPPNVSCLSPDNAFQLYISDANGNFNSEIKIGEISGFYSTYINGIIPSGLVAGNGYKLRVKTTSPQQVILYSGSINIVAAQGQPIDLAPSNQNQVLSSETYGWCGSAVGDNKAIVLRAVNSSIVQNLTSKNLITGTSTTYTPTAAGFSLDNIAVGYYAIIASATTPSGVSNVLSVKTYLLLNVPSKVNIQSGGTDFGCIDPETGTGADITYSINIAGETGIQNNYPGSTYLITWGDGREDRFTHCELMANSGALNHNYQKTSCGQPPINLGNGTTIQNAFRVSVTTINPFCSDDPVSATTYPKIFSKPVAHIDPATATAVCINTPVTFSNSSTKGNNSNCSLTMQWKWYVDDVLISTDEVFVYDGFTTPGIHTVKLVANNDVGICRPSEDVRSVCVQFPPKPEFNFNGAQGASGCAPLSLKPTNTSVIDANCNAENTYLWNVTGGTVAYLNGTNENSREPEFNFLTAGIYKISLSITTASCGLVTSTEQTVLISAAPTVLLSDDAIVCNLTTYDFNNTTNGPTRTEFTGTEDAQPDTYTWTVSGGDYAFVGGTDLHSQYPKIDFRAYATYTVTVVHKNNCGTATDTQTITFKTSPIVNAGSYPAVCYDAQISLKGEITGSVNSFEWVGGTGTFSPGRNDLNAVYTPSDAERAAGKVDLTLRALTSLTAPCNVIEGYASIAIKAQNSITSASEKEICRGTSVDYTPVALSGSTFNWTIVRSVNASGFNPSGSGTQITDVLSSTNPAVAGTVVYRITAVLDGCESTAQELTVTIAPEPTATASVVASEICSGTESGIRISSAQPGLGYLWISSTTGGQITGNTSNNTTPQAITELNDLLINDGTSTGNVTYTITPVSSNGCPGRIITLTISVKAAPKVTGNIITGDQTLCEGQPTAILTGVSPAGGPYTYQWQSSTDGTLWTDISGATGLSYNPGLLSVTTMYRRKVIVPNCNGTLDFPSNTVVVTINYSAKAEFTFVSDQGCTPFQIDAGNISTTAYPDRNATYTWYADNVSIGTGVTFPGYTISTESRSVVIRLVVTSSKGCANAEMSHTFKSLQVIQASFITDKTQGCGPLTVNFTNRSTSLTNTTFQWDFGNGQISSEVSPGGIVFQPDPSGKDKNYTITLTATSSCGVSDPFTATILVRGAAKSVFSPQKTTGCSPLTVAFTNTSPAASNTTYTYDFGDGSSPVTTTDRSNVNHVFTTNVTKTFTVKMTASGACGEHTSEHLITVLPSTVKAELVVNGPDKRGCAPFTVPFYNNSTGAETFMYDFGDGSTAATITAPEKVEHTFTKAGIYTVTLTAVGCSSASTTETIVVLAQPEVSFAAERNEDCTCLEMRFINTTKDGASYLWDFGDGSTSVETNPVHIFPATGTYKVTLTASNLNGCKSTVVNDIPVTGIPGNLFVPNSFIPDDPNPELRLFSAKGSGLKSWRLSVFDKWGELMWETDQLADGKPAQGWDGTYRGQPMPQGVYFWKAEVQFLNGTRWRGMSYNDSAPKRSGILNLIR